MKDSNLTEAVRSALAVLICALPRSPEPSKDLTAAWVRVLTNNGIEPYQIEPATDEALELETFPAPVAFMRICQKHRRALELTESDCLPINTTAPALEMRSVAQIRADMKAAIPREPVEPTPEQVADADAERKRQIEALKLRQA